MKFPNECNRMIMKRFLFIFALLGLAIGTQGQKTRVLSVFQMIESGKYDEAKEAIELAVWNDNTSKWNRTYYAKGLLCQKAFEAGFENNDPKKTNLYPDQLVVAYNAYEKALQLGSRNRVASSITVQYYALANDFQKMGERYFLSREYSSALEAFEHALMVSKSPLLSVKTDTNLVHNAAMAAFEARDWNKAISYLIGLNDDAYSPNTALLLYHSYVNNGDSTTAEQVLFDGEDKYKSEESIVLQLVDLLVNTQRLPLAIEILDRAASRRPENYHFPWTRGLVYQRMKLYDEAIASLLQASLLGPGEIGIYYNLGICYYNIGVNINESARQIKNSLEYQSAHKKSMDQFSEAVNWLEKAYALDPSDQQTISKLYQLYHRLQMTEKRRSMELLMR